MVDFNSKLEVGSIRKRQRSKIWDLFIEIEQEGEGKRVKCIHCHKEYSVDSKTGTSHLHRHQLSCQKRSVSADTKCSKQIDQDIFLQKLVFAIIRHGYPFSWFEDQANRDIITSLNGQIKPISRNTIETCCVELHHNEKEQLRILLGKISGRVCLTAGIWTSCTTEDYLCVTVHYVDNDWKLCTRILSFRVVPIPYDATMLFETIHDLLREWGINKKVFTLTLDNSNIMDTMQGLLRDQLCARNSLLRNGEFFRIECCANILDIFVQDGVELISEAISKIRDSVLYVNGSERKLIFSEAVELSDCSSSKGLWLDVPTRWNSTFLMLDRAIFYKPAFATLAIIDENYVNYPTIDEWSRIEKIHKVLEPFYEFSKLFYQTDYPTANLFFERIWKMHLCLMEMVESSDEDLRNMAGKIKNQFDKYWADYSPIISMAVILDPRYKLEFVRVCYEKLGDENKWMNIRYQMRNLFNEYDKSGSNPYRFENNINELDTLNFQDYARSSQLELYLAEPKEDPVLEFNVLDYWKENQDRFPELSLMARDILSVPITGFVSESAFGTGDRILGKWKDCIITKHVEAVIATRSWLYGYTGYSTELEDMNVVGEEIKFVESEGW